MQKRIAKVGWFLIPLLSISLAIVLNNIILISGIAKISPRYQEAAASLYAPAFWKQILLVGISVPILEELLFRSLAFGILRKWMSFVPAMLLSSIVFGVYHGNIVQFIYATLCGLLLAYLFERFGVVASVVSHMSMNLSACILTELGVYEWMFGKLWRVVVITILMSAVFVVLYRKVQKLDVT